MEIIIGKTAGFCYGVKRAVEGAKEELKQNNGSIYCLGELVHNKQVVEELKNQGMIFVNNLLEAENMAIIRAHGVEKQIYEEAEKENIKLKDYTCPNVLKIHEIANEFSKKGYYIFLCGNKNHPENIGTISYCGDNAYIIESEDNINEALEKINNAIIKKFLLISQTTYSLEKFHKIEKIIKSETSKDIELVVKNTICRATELRQKETEKLAKEVDYMIIIGGKNSSNTRKLYEIAKKNCNNSISIEKAAELNLDDINSKAKIGIMAGASTPRESIEKVCEKLKLLKH